MPDAAKIPGFSLPGSALLPPETGKPDNAEHLSESERFERLACRIRDAFSLPLSFSNPDLRSLRGQASFGVRLQTVGSCFAGAIESTAYTAEMRRGSRREESVSLVFVLSGTMSLSQNNNFGTMRPGHAYLFNAARPARFAFHTPFSEVVVGIPKDRLSDYVPGFDRSVATPLPVTPGLALLRSLALSSTASSDMGKVPQEAISSLSETFLSLAGSSLAELLGQGSAPVSREALLRLIEDFMQRHLADPDLDPAQIAAANRLSERALYAVFRQSGQSVMEALWKARLARARELLASPGHAMMSAAEVGYACGFKNPAHFSTRFRKAFGLTPLEFREEHLRALRDER